MQRAPSATATGSDVARVRTLAAAQAAAQAAPAAVPEISVVIPHLNQPAALAACLDALAAQTIAPERFEVVVVDNGSTDPAGAIVARLPGARFAEEPAPGPGPARNRGVALARAPLLAFIDADCLPDPGWLGAILARFAADPGLAALGGEVVVFAADPDRPNAAEAFDMVFGFRQGWQIARHGFAATANLAIRREVFEAVGPFAGIAVSEDRDWGRRAAALGFPTRHAAEAVVRHPARRSMAELRAQWDRHVSHYHAMQPPGLRGQAAWALSAGLVALSPLADLPQLLASDRLAGPGDRLRGLAGLTRLRLYRARRMLAALAAASAREAAARWNRS